MTYLNIYSPETQHRQSKYEEQCEHEGRICGRQYVAQVQDDGDAGHRDCHLQERDYEPGQRVPAEVHAHY